MTDETTVTAWMNGYLTAWDSNAPDDIRALFTEDAEYRTAPFDQARVGHEAIVAGWVEDADSPGDHTFTWRIAGIDGELAFVEGDTDYGERAYANLWVIRLEDDGRASSFTEWYMKRRNLDAFKNWVGAYRKAWESNEPDDIRALFTEDGVYYATPTHSGWKGHDEIVRHWLEHQDPPGSTTFEWKQVSFDGETGVATAVSGYPDGPKKGTYDNVWIVELAADGRARTFRDAFIARSE